MTIDANLIIGIHIGIAVGVLLGLTVGTLLTWFYLCARSLR